MIKQIGNTQINLIEYAIRSNAILATRGAGKTHTGKFIAESLMDADIVTWIIDSTGNWRYLKEPNAKGGNGYPVLVVGKNKDVDFDLDNLEGFVGTLLSNKISVVFDLSDEDSYENKDEIISSVCSVLRFGKHGLMHLIVEESGEYLGQTSKKSLAGESLSSLMKIGGNYKVGVTIINQNAETISKEVLKFCNGFFIGIQREKNSIKNILDWLKHAGVDGAKEISVNLPSLKPGQFYIWSSGNSTSLEMIPDIKSSHPSRYDIPQSDLDMATDVESVIKIMSTSFRVSKNLIEEKEVDDSNGVEPMFHIELKNLGIMDGIIWRMADNTPYGDSTVRTVIDRMVGKGGVKESDGDFLSFKDGSKWWLHSKIERKYADLCMRVISENLPLDK